MKKIKLMKKIKKWGSGIGIFISKEECDIYKFKEGDVLNIDVNKVNQLRNHSQVERSQEIVSTIPAIKKVEETRE